MKDQITPALNEKVTKRAIEICDENKGTTKADLEKAFNKSIKEHGYSVAYYNRVMRAIAHEEEHFDDVVYAG